MLTAKEAYARYDETKLFAKKYFNEVISPAILKVANDSTSCKFKMNDVYYVGESFRFTGPYPHNYGSNVDLTNAILAVIREQGFTTKTIHLSSGNEYTHGDIDLIVSWDLEEEEK